MRLAFQLFAFAIFFWMWMLVWRVHGATMRHIREWVMLNQRVVNLLPDELRDDEWHRASQQMMRQVDELRAIRAWPFPIRLGK